MEDGPTEEVCVALGADLGLGARASGVWPGREDAPGPQTPDSSPHMERVARWDPGQDPFKWETQGLEWLRSKGGAVRNHILLGHFLVQGKT